MMKMKSNSRKEKNQENEKKELAKPEQNKGKIEEGTLFPKRQQL